MGRTKKFTDEQLWQAIQELLLDVGYDAFTVSLLAEKMGVSRAVIYKYYPNKEELVIQFMLEKMKYSIQYLSEVQQSQPFLQMFRDLLKRIYDMKDLHQVLGFTSKIGNKSEVVKEKKTILSSMHQNLYEPLLSVVAKGKEEGLIQQHQNDFVLLSFIFTAIDMPNHLQLSEEAFLINLEQLLLNGILNKN